MSEPGGKVVALHPRFEFVLPIMIVGSGAAFAAPTHMGDDMAEFVCTKFEFTGRRGANMGNYGLCFVEAYREADPLSDVIGALFEAARRSPNEFTRRIDVQGFPRLSVHWKAFGNLVGVLEAEDDGIAIVTSVVVPKAGIAGEREAIDYLRAKANDRLASRQQSLEFEDERYRRPFVANVVFEHRGNEKYDASQIGACLAIALWPWDVYTR